MNGKHIFPDTGRSIFFIICFFHAYHTGKPGNSISLVHALSLLSGNQHMIPDSTGSYTRSSVVEELEKHQQKGNHI